MLKLYNKNGYADMHSIMSLPVPFILCIGGRGTGKTYGAFAEMLDNYQPFIYLRRTRSQQELAQQSEFAPLNPVAKDRGELYTAQAVNNYVGAYYHGEAREDGKVIPAGAPVGYILSLSTISNARSFDMSDCKVILYDECIPEKHERRIKNEPDAILNMYETINRNRELKGQEPIKMVMLANANNYDSAVLEAFRLVRTIETMHKRKQSVQIDKRRGIAVVLLQDSPIAAAKSETALYKVAASTDFERMAIGNDFETDAYTDIATRPLSEYTSLVCCGGMCIYTHKNTRDYYVCGHISGAPDKYSNTPDGRQAMRRKYYWLWDLYLQHYVVFESVEVKTFFRGVFALG